jgi:hypothetical protein
LISGNIITRNGNDHYGGGGIRCIDSDAMIVGNVIARNWTGSFYSWPDGGGVYCQGGSPTLLDNEISGNGAGGDGGGICCDSARIVNNRITGNSAGSDGGGVRCESAYVSGNLISGNRVDAWGGAIRCGSARVVGNTIVANVNYSGSGAIHCSSADIRNNIIADSEHGYGIFCQSGTSPVIECNDVWNNRGGNYGNYPDQTGSNGNISDDPLFCGPESPRRPYALFSGSPCAPAQQGECGLIGAFGVGCSGTAPAVKEVKGEETPVVALPDEPPPCFAFHASSPNPSSRGTSVRFDLPERRYVRLVIHDVKGRLVRALVDGELPPRSHTVTWNGRDASGREVSGGVYFVHLEAGPDIENSKVIVVR